MNKQTIQSSDPFELQSQTPQKKPNLFPNPFSFLNINHKYSLNLNHILNLNHKHSLNLITLLTLLTLTFLIAMAPSAKAQFMHSQPPIEAYLSAGAGYNYEIEAVSVRLFVGFPATREFYSYSVDGGYYMHELDGRANTGDMNFNLRFYIPGSAVFRPYVLTGANYTHYNYGFWGVNMGGGLQVAIGQVFLFARTQYTIGEVDMLSVNSGLSFIFPTSMR